MKSRILFLFSLLISTAICYAQDDQPAPYDSGWYLATNAIAPLTSFPSYHPLTGNPSYPGGTTAIAEAITPDISALARNLENDPTRIFNYVHDHIRYVHYFGSHKGAEMTLLERSGNDFDQCALLVALLRSAGYSCSYVFGLISIPYSAPNQQDYQHWVGATLPNTNWNLAIGLAVNLNGSFGYPITGSFPSDTNDIGFHHVWVQATVNGTNYNLDPSYKVNLPISGLNLDSAMQMNTSSLISAVSSGSTATPDYVQGLNEANLRNTLSSYNSNLLTYIQGNYPNYPVQQIIGGQAIVPSTGQPLGQTTPFTVQTGGGQYPTSTWTYIPTSLMAVLIVNLPGTNNSFYLPGLAGSRLSLVSTSNGVAQLWQDDTLMTSVQTTGSGPTFTPTLGIQHPFGTNWSFSTPGFYPARYNGDDQSVSTQPYQRTNATYVLLYGLDANNAWLTERQQKLDNYRQGYGDSSQQVTMETLNVMGLGWLTQTELAQELLAGQTATVDHFVHRLGRMGMETGKGYYIDVYEQVLPTVSNHSTNTDGIYAQNQAFQIGSYFASAMEHAIIEQLQNSNLVAASTVKLLELASTNSQRIYLATSANWTSGANVSGNISNYSTTNLYTNFINQGYYLLLPQNGSIQLPGTNSWAGSGYVAYQAQANGAQVSKMIIGGGYNGGYVNLPTATPSPSTISLIDVNTPSYFNLQPVTVGMPTGTAADPVSMVDGSFQVTSGDLALGGTEPRGLNLTRYYSSARRNTSLAGLAPGWMHSYYGTVSAQSGWQASLGATTPQQMTPMIVAIRAAADIYNSAQPSASNWVTTALIAKWGIDQIIKNAVSISLGNQTVQFVRQPNGSFTPPANSTMTLSTSGSGYSLQERHGRTFYFGSNNLLTNIADQYGQSMSFTYNSSNWVQTVNDWKNRTLTFTYTGPNLTSVTDGSRTVHYGYTGPDLTSFTDADGNVFTYQYDSDHQVIATLDALNRLIVTNNYDINGRITTQMTQGLTNKLWQVFASGWQTTAIDPMGGQQNYFFDDQSRQTGFQDAVGNLTQTFYDGQAHVVQTVSPRGETNQFIYDGNNNLIETIDPLGFSNVFGFDGNNNLIASTDGRGNTSHFGYNAEFSPTGSTNGNGDWFVLAYTSDGSVQSRTDSAGATTYSYTDSYEQLTGISYPTGFGSESFVNTAFGDVTSHSDARGLTTTFAYNNRRQLTNTVAPGSLTSSANFDANGNQATTTDARGNITSNTWSVTKHLLTTTLPATPQGTPVITTTYDAREWLASTQNPLGKTSYYTNDAAQRLIASADPLQRTTRFAYDPDGNQTNVTDAASEQTTQTFDARGSVAKIVDGAGDIVGKAYDGAGNLIYLTNRNGKVWQFQYDGANRLVNTTSPLGYGTSHAFNNRGLLVTNTDGLGQKTTFVWNARGSMTTRADNVGTTTYQPDLNGNVTNVSENGKSFRQQFDPHNWLTNYTDVNSYSVGYRRDNNGNVTNIIYPGGLTVSLALDGNNRITNVTDWANRKTAIAYDLAGHETSVTRPNNTLRSVAYDDDGEVTNIVEKLTSQFPIAFYTLHYNAAGRCDWEFKGPLPHSSTPPTRNSTFDADNRLLSFNGTNVTVDADGNLTYGPGTNGTFLTYSYDARNRLTSADGVGYTYDSANNRVAVTNGTNVATYVVDPVTSRVLMRVTATTTNYYIYGNGLLYEIDIVGVATTVSYYHFDLRGSTVALTDANGNLTDQFEYSPYGTQTYHAGVSSTPFLYNGRFGVQTDNNGFLYMNARYYNPYICRFLNPDPSGFNGGLNLYQFASGNPVSLMDPTGLGTATANGTPADTQNPYNINYNQYVQPCIVCHGVSANGFNGNVNSFYGLTALPGSGPNAMQGYATEEFIAQTITPFIAGPAGGLIGDALDAGTTAAITATATSTAVQVGDFTLTGTVAGHLSDTVGGVGEYSGSLARPYLQSPSTINEIMATGQGVADPGGVAGALRYDVPGTFRGSSGTWQLVVNPNNNIIYHFNFVAH
jgi:RHS repeat-associated protein